MATVTSAPLSHSANGHDGRPSFIAEFRSFWHQFLEKAFDPYRPELHYMRGPGPACRAKQAAARRIVC